MNSFFGYSVVEKLKFTYFDDRKDFSTEESKKKINATNNKFKKKIDDIKNEKIKKSLVEFTKVFNQPDGNFPNGIPNPLLLENRQPTIDAVIAAAKF